MPKTLAGKWSVWLIVVFIASLIVVQILVASGQQGGETFSDNWLIAIPMFAAGLAAISALVTGVIAIFKKKDRSALVYIASLIGFLVFGFILGEVLSSH